MLVIGIPIGGDQLTPHTKIFYRMMFAMIPPVDPSAEWMK